MPVAESGDDSRRLLLRVYDDHQPSAGSDITLEEPLTMRPAVWFSMVRRVERVHDGRQMWLELVVTVVRIQDVQQPGVLKEHHTHAVRRGRFREDRAILAHGRRTTRRRGASSCAPAGL